MDGNRRWAKNRGLPPSMGHWDGAEVLTDIVKAASDMGIQTVTVFAFSTENWARPSSEIDSLMHLFEIYLTNKRDSMIKDGVRLHAIGNLDRLPAKVLNAFEISKKATEKCKKINLVLAMNYGGRDALRRAFSKLINQKVSAEEITEKMIADVLETAPFGDPDLLIRTSGETRVSNFLLWEMAYTEFYTTEILRPDFSAKDLQDAVNAYLARSRRKGGGE